MVAPDAKYKVGNKTIESTSISAPFDEAKAELESEEYSIITPKQFAQLRIANGASHEVSTSGAYISMGSVMIPQKGRFFTPNLSLVMQNPVEATNAHRANGEFYVSNEDAEKALASGSVVIPYKQSGVPTNRFGEDPITVLAFGEKTAQKYGDFLKNSEYEITEMPLVFDDKSYINSKEKPFANQAWLHGLDCGYRSLLYGGGRYLNCRGAVRGVREASASQGAKPQKNLGREAYTPVQTARTLSHFRIGGLEAQFIEQLRKVYC